MKMLLKQLVTVCFSGILLVSCAAQDGRSGPTPDIDYRGSDCISIRTIRDYTPLDSRSLLIEGAGKRTYFVTLVVSSFELRSSHQLGFSSRDDWLCPYGGDAIIFDSFTNEQVGIRSVSKVTPEQAEELLIRYGKKQPAEIRDQEPREIEGAKVEELGEIG